MTIYKYVCSICGSENVRRDAWATWDVETQSWELATVFQAGFCDDCGGIASLDAIKIDRMKARSSAAVDSFGANGGGRIF